MASNNFPTDIDLKTYISDNLEHFTSAVRNAVGELSESYFNSVKTRKRGWKILRWTLIGFILGLSIIEHIPWVGSTLLGLSVLSLLWGVKMVRAGNGRHIREVIRKAHLTLLPIIATTAGVASIHEIKQRKKDKNDFDTAYSKPDENFFQRNNRLAKASFQLSTTYDYDELVQKLEKSALLAEMQDKIRVLLMLPIIYKVETKSKNVTFTQLLSRPFAAGKDASQDLKIFVRKMSKSLFIEVPLSQTFSGTTVITTEKFSSGSDQDLYIKSLRNIGLNVSELEWNDFEDLLHVSTSDPVEARYILTPDFMESVYRWWQEKKQDIRISFTGNSMNILIFGNQVSFGGDLADVSDEAIKHHVEAWLIPLVHSMYLVNAYSESR